MLFIIAALLFTAFVTMAVANLLIEEGYWILGVIAMLGGIGFFIYLATLLEVSSR